MREAGSVEFMRGMHRFITERRGGVFQQRHLVAEFLAETPGRLDAGVRDETDQHDPSDTTLPELQVEVGVREAARAPMLLNNNFTFL